MYVISGVTPIFGGYLTHKNEKGGLPLKGVQILLRGYATVTCFQGQVEVKTGVNYICDIVLVPDPL